MIIALFINCAFSLKMPNNMEECNFFKITFNKFKIGIECSFYKSDVKFVVRIKIYTKNIKISWNSRHFWRDVTNFKC
jgi:hypothetical protein